MGPRPPLVAAMTGEMSDTAFRERVRLEGHLGLLLCEYLWGQTSELNLGGQQFETAGDEVPGYENDNMALLLRRKADGEVFEVEIDVTFYPALKIEPAQTGTAA
jgi:hypothetical protein